jgi:DNA-binding transcriptional ArsR family regulator
MYGQEQKSAIADLQSKAAVATTLLRTIANKNRLLILCHLLESEKTVNELERLIGLRQSAMSQHLAILRRDHLVRTRRKAQFVYYSLASAEAKAIMTTLYELYCTPPKRPGRC